MKLKLLGDMIAVRRTEKKQESKLYIPNQEEKIFTGEVFAVGPGQRKTDGTLHPTTVVKGDTVMYLSTTGYLVNDPVTKESYTLMYERDVVCILEDEEVQEETVVDKAPAKKKTGKKK